MKELSIKEKAKAYDEAYRKVAIRFGSNVADEIFPELKESEDEKISKAIKYGLDHVFTNNTTVFGVTKEQCLAWLEKQGEQKPYGQREECLDCQVNYAGECKGSCAIKKDECEENVDNSNKIEPKDYSSIDPHFFKTADKVEPKFKVGDWVVYDHNAYQVVELPKEGYINLGLKRNGKIEFAPSTYCRPWTTQNAKAGDVLATEGFIFIFKEIREDKGVGYFCANEKELHEGNDNTFHIANPNSLMGSVNNDFTHYTPATEEQRNLLFQKMKEAGYEWDADKKELRKIEQKPAEEYNITGIGSKNAQGKLGEMIKKLKPVNEVLEQNPAWSEEDEKHIMAIDLAVNRCLGKWHFCGEKCPISEHNPWLKSLKDRVQPQPKQRWSEEDNKIIEEIINDIECAKAINYHAPKEGYEFRKNWLKSLRPQSHWKPSDEQIEALSAMKRHCEIATSFDAYKQEIVESLYQDLKKLKG